MLKQQMQVQVYSKCKSTLSLSQLRLVPKVGQWGQLSLRVVQLQKFIKWNKLNYPQTQGYNHLQKNTKCYNDYTIYKDTTRYRRYKEV